MELAQRFISTKKGKVLTAIGVVFLLLVVLIAVSEPEESPEEPVQEVAGQEESPTPPPVEVQISAAELSYDYDANPVAADKKYKGKRGRIHGVVTDISAGGHVLIESDVPCMVQHIRELEPLVKGQSIVVEGIIGGYQVVGQEMGRAFPVIPIFSCSIVN